MDKVNWFCTSRNNSIRQLDILLEREKNMEARKRLRNLITDLVCQPPMTRRQFIFAIMGVFQHEDDIQTVLDISKQRHMLEKSIYGCIILSQNI